MRRTLIFILISISSFSLFAQSTTVNYEPSNADMPNPERGFYFPTSTSASNYTPLNASILAENRSYYEPYDAEYDVHSTLVFRYFILDNFINSSISTTFLNNMQADFDAARTAGVKLIIRFSYTNTPPTGDCGSWICPPYGDATKARILGHISQLKPLLQSNKDIIATVQMGFIGVWGENYYTDHFGDASQSPFILTNTNWTDRNDVLTALLDAVPKERTIQVRYPQIKQRNIYGLGASTSSAALTLQEAHNQNDKARIGFHNDCFLASDTDFGTYNDYGPPSSSADTINLKPYLADDSRFVPVGGETCSTNNPWDDCSSDGGMVEKELSRFHYSFLNSDYNNPDVNNDWVGTCIEDIKRKLGYRIQLKSGTYPNTAQAGSSFPISMTLENVGYSAPFNPRGIELVLRNANTNETFFAPLSDVDPRLWLTGTHSISEMVCLSPNMPTGSYDLLLNLPDPEPTLFDNPNYAIQLANTNMWEANTGFNDLNHTIQITNATNTMVCYGDNLFTSKSIYDPNYCEAILNLNNPIETDYYIADETILTNGNISSGKIVIFQAGDDIQLNQNFEVEIGATFLAIMRACVE